jgi:hypothetical protein
MSIAIICDHCKQIIQNTDSMVKIEYKDLKTIFRHYHKDCFNYKFSTDIARINDD